VGKLGVAVLCVCVAGAAATDGAWADGIEPADFTHDTALYFTAPLRWDSTDWMYFGGALAAVAAAHSLDGKVRDHFAGSNPVLNGQDPRDTEDYLPAVGLLTGTLLVAEMAGDSYGKGEVATMMEASIFSVVTAEGLKYAAGRERPNETLNPNDWRMSGSSFPSLHSDLAFAVGTVFAESGDDDYRWFRRFIGYGVATTTLYLRLHDNAHWFSDTVAGAAIGMASAHFSINRRLERPDDHPEALNISIAPMAGGGVKLAFSLSMD
jgi:hypothetical protein